MPPRARPEPRRFPCVGRTRLTRRSSPRARPPLVAACLLAASGLAVPSPADAHPHVFVIAKETLVFTPDGRVGAIRASWTFDDMYSAFVTQGIGEEGKIPTSEQLAPLAKTNVESLAEFGYFTVAKSAGKPVAFEAPTEYRLDEGQDRIVTLHFTLPLKEPASASRFFSLQVYDPTYFVSFDLADKDPVAMVGAPPGCSLSVVKPAALDATDNQKLTESFFTNLSPGVDFGIKMATRATVACP